MEKVNGSQQPVKLKPFTVRVQCCTKLKTACWVKGRSVYLFWQWPDAEGMIIKMETADIPANTTLVIVYGGATGKKFSRDGDIGADPESSFYLQPAYCKDNRYTIYKNTFQLSYGLSKALSEEERYEIQYGNKQPDTAAKEKPKELVGVFPENAEVQIADAEKQQYTRCIAGIGS